MTTELATIDARAFMPRNFTELDRLATMLATTNMIPAVFKGKPGDCAAAIMMGAELGVSPMQSLQGIAVINGRPAIWGDLMIGLVRSHPECTEIDERVDVVGGVLTASCKVVRSGKAQTRTFSEADAKKAGLWGKAGPWTQYPNRMLQMRARAFALRDMFADALKGIAIAEESEDIGGEQSAATATATVQALPAVEKPQYPQDRYERSFSSWQALIKDGKKTSAELIETISEKYTLTDAQLAEIQEIELQVKGYESNEANDSEESGHE